MRDDEMSENGHSRHSAVAHRPELPELTRQLLARQLLARQSMA